jgi:hypothetical protein
VLTELIALMPWPDCQSAALRNGQIGRTLAESLSHLLIFCNFSHGSVEDRLQRLAEESWGDPGIEGFNPNT